MRTIVIFLILIVCGFSAYALELTSGAFENGGQIPTAYSCDSVDASPSLSWSGVPANTVSFVLICDDPDAPFGTWVHWVVFNIPKERTHLEEDFAKVAVAEDGTMQGLNDFGKVGYGGPCPPEGKAHRYLFKLYALDTTLSLSEQATKKDIIKAMQGHIIAETKLIGTYKR